MRLLRFIFGINKIMNLRPPMLGNGGLDGQIKKQNCKEIKSRSGDRMLFLNESGVSDKKDCNGTFHMSKIEAFKKLAITIFVIFCPWAQAGVFLNDTFTDADTTTLFLHKGEVSATWVRPLSANTTTIKNNRVRSTISSGGPWLSGATPASADYSVSAVIRPLTLTSASVGVVGRCEHACGHFYTATANFGAQNFWTLYKYTGSYTQLATSAETLTANVDRTITLDMVGTTIRVLVDGSQVISVTDSSVTATGAPGVFFSGSTTDTTGLHIDSVSATDSGTTPVFSNHVNFVVDGDSISGDFTRLGTKTLANELSLPSRWNSSSHWNFSVAGQTVVTALTDVATQTDPIYPLTAGASQRLFVCMIGINDIVGADSAATIEANVRKMSTDRQTAGFKTLGMTIMKTTALSGATLTKWTTINSNLVADPSSFTYFLDAANVTHLTAPGDTTYFVDGVHLTVAGVGVLADAIVTKVPLPPKQSFFLGWKPRTLLDQACSWKRGQRLLLPPCEELFAPRPYKFVLFLP